MEMAFKAVWYFSLLQTISTAFHSNVESPGSSWVTRQGFYYFFSRGKQLPFYEASAYCRTFGAELTSIANLDEQTFIHNHITSDSVMGTQDFWIGLYKKERAQNGILYFLDGTPLTITNWSYNEPNEVHCCIRLTEDLVWRDKHCESTYNFICKKSPSQSVPMWFYKQKKLTDKWVEGLSLCVVENKCCSRLYCATLCLRDPLCKGYNIRKVSTGCLCELKGTEHYLTRQLGEEKGSSYWE